MENPKERRKRLLKTWEEEKIERLESSFKDLIDFGVEKWTQNYTISHSDKLKQIDAMIEYFEQPEIEEYEKCQYLLDVKRDLDQYRYML
tara:strand:- start:3794 stop:4060 length:267 start_codon:yes stop_codon:yes gene_type:complete